MSKRIASCSCGRLRVEVTGDPFRVSVCHCLACQRRSGSAFAVQARFPRAAATISGQGTEYVRVGDEGGRATFTFCPTCGDTVFYVTQGSEDSLAIPVGAFADPTLPAPMVSVYENRKHGWVEILGDMERM